MMTMLLHQARVRLAISTLISVLRVCACMHAHTHTLTHTYTHTLLEHASGKQAGGIIVKGTLCGVCLGVNSSSQPLEL